jgi:hypothetical protein
MNLYLLLVGFELVYANWFPPYMMLRQRGVVAPPENLFDDFAGYILKRFKSTQLLELVEDIHKFSKVKKAHLSLLSKPLKINPYNLYSIESAISLFSNLKFEYSEGENCQVYKETTLLDLLSQMHFYHIFSEYQNRSSFIDGLVAQFRIIALRENSSKLLSVYYFIQRLPLLQKLSGSQDFFPFIKFCNLLLRNIQGQKINPEQRQNFLSTQEVAPAVHSNQEFILKFFGVYGPQGQHLDFISFSSDEVSLGLDLILDFMGIGQKKVEIPPGCKELQDLFSKEKSILWALINRQDNIHISRLTSCIILLAKSSLVNDYRAKLIPTFFGKSSLLDKLSSSMLYTVMKYITAQFDNLRFQDDYRQFSNLTPSEKLDLNTFIGIVGNESNGFCSSNPKEVKESIIRLGVEDCREPILLIAKLFLPHFLKPDLRIKDFYNDFLAEQQKIHSLVSTFLFSNVYIESLNPSTKKSLKHFLEFVVSPDETIFCLFGDPRLDVISPQYFLLIYYVSKLVDALVFPGGGPLVEFVLLYVKSTALIHKIFVNLQRAFDRLPFDFTFMFGLFSPAERYTLQNDLCPSINFETWCNYLLHVLRMKFTEEAFLQEFYRGYELHPKKLSLHGTNHNYQPASSS